MELRELATFRIVAHELSFTQAANLLGYAQSSVTAQIQSLETELGVPLFNRLGRRIILTDAGQRLLWYAEKLLNLAEEAHSVVTATNELRGTLTIGAPESICTYYLPPVLRHFRETVPNVQIIVKPVPYAQLVRGVKDGVVDVAFLIEVPTQAPSLNIEILTREPIYIVAAPDHPLAHQAVVTPADLEHTHMLLTERGCPYRMLFDRLLTAAGVYPSTALEFESIEAIKQCVMVGLGIGVLPKLTVEKALYEGEIVALHWSAPFQVYTQMVWHKERWVSPVLSAFLEISRQMLRDADPLQNAVEKTG